MQVLSSADNLSEEAAEHRHMKFYSHVTCSLAMMMIVVGVGLDAAFYPESLEAFGLTRVLVALIVGAILLSFATPFGDRHIRQLSYLWMALPQVMIVWMISRTDGEASVYFVGLTLGVAGIGVFLPLTIREAIGYSAFTMSAYVVACLASTSGIQHWEQLLGNLLFLGFFAVIAVATSIYSGRWRRCTLQLQNEVERQRNALIESNRALTEVKGQLVHREKMAAIGTLSAGLLHEVNNPVNFSLMAIDMGLQQSTAAAQQDVLRESLVDAREGLVRIQSIVSDLKTFAYQKPDGDSHRDFLLEKAIRSAMRLTSHELKGIDVRCQLPLDTHVLGDEPALIGVLINLLSNAAHAVHAARRDRPEIVISATPEGDRLVVSVRDNGDGIRPENIARVFEPFFTTRDVGSGLGLGLSICYGIVQRHGGTLSVRSEPGAWTEFSFQLTRACMKEDTGC